MVWCCTEKEQYNHHRKRWQPHAAAVTTDGQPLSCVRLTYKLILYVEVLMKDCIELVMASFNTTQQRTAVGSRWDTLDL